MNQPPHGPQGQPPYGEQPPQGQPSHGGYPGQPHGGPPPARSSGTGPIIAVIIGAVVIIGVLVTLWLTGVFGSRAGTTIAVAPAPTVPVAPAPAPVTIAPPAPVTAGSAVTRDYLIGVWGPVCPNARTGSLEFRADGTIVSAQGVASWTLSGSIVTTVGGGVTESSTWTPQGPDEATVVVPNIGTATLRRCATAF